MTNILLIIIIILIAPWILDIVLGLGIFIGIIGFIVAGVLILYFSFEKEINEILQVLIPILILSAFVKYTLYDKFIKYVIEGYNEEK